MAISKNKNRLKQLAELQGRKLGLFLTASGFTKKEKEAWLTLIPKMSLEQIEKVLEIFETAYLDQKTKNIDKVFLEKLKIIRDEINQKEEDLINKTIDKINNLKKF